MALPLPGSSGMPSQPGGVQINATWYRLAVDQKGTPQYRQRPSPFYPAQVSQADMTEAQVSPDGRLPFSLRDLSGGGGLAQQGLTGNLTRFDRCGDAEGEGVDATMTPSGPLVLSGRLRVPIAAGGTQDASVAGIFWQAQQNAYASAGSQVFMFDGAALALQGSLGAGAVASNAIVAYQGAQSAPYWYQPCGYATAARYSTDLGLTWTAVGAGGGLVAGAMHSMAVMDGEVVVATRSPRRGDAMICTFDDGGPTPTIQGVIDPIGATEVAISRVVVFNGRVLVVKNWEGLFLLSDDRRSMEEELFPEWRGLRIYSRGMTVWRGHLWVPTSNGLYSVGPALDLQKIGPSESETSSLAPLAPRGPITAVDGDAYNLYAFRESPDGPSWVYKAVVTVGAGVIQDITWFPWSQQAPMARCRAMAVVRPGPMTMPDMDAAAARPPRLLFDRQAQPHTETPDNAAVHYTTAFYKLPAVGRDPRTDATYEYAPAGTLYYSRLLARFPSVIKAWYSLTPLCAPLEYKLDGTTATTAHSVRLRWKLDVTASTTATPYGYTEGSFQRTGVGAPERFDPPLFGRGFDTGVRLASSDLTTSPQVYSVTTEYDLRPVPIWRHEMTLDLSSGAYSVGGGQGYGDPFPPARALVLLRGLAGAPGSMDFVDLYGARYAISVPVDGVSLRASGGAEGGYDGQVPLLVDVICVEQLVRDQGTWRTVALYRWRDLAKMTWRQVRQLG